MEDLGSTNRYCPSFLDLQACKQRKCVEMQGHADLDDDELGDDDDQDDAVSSKNHPSPKKAAATAQEQRKKAMERKILVNKQAKVAWAGESTEVNGTAYYREATVGNFAVKVGDVVLLNHSGRLASDN